MLRILLVGGGTGGHVYPLVAVAEELKNQEAQKGIDLELLFLGEGNFFQEAAKSGGYNFKTILAGKLRRYPSLLNLIDVFKIPVGFLQSLWHIYWFMPDVIFAKGGYASVSPALVAKIYFIPLYIHESDSMPGLANRILGRLAVKIFTSFQISSAYFNSSKVTLVGNPVRKDLISGNREEALKSFGFEANKKTIFIYGGSQGAQKINNAILEALVMMVNNGWQIIHQCGTGQYNAVKSETDRIIKEGEGSYAESIKRSYKYFAFMDARQLASAYALCDVAISRAGAGSIFEIATLGKPAILIPLSTDSSRGEQINNATELARHGAVMIEEENLTPHILISQVMYLLKPENYEVISQNIKNFAMPEAATKIASAILVNPKL